jgi:hypothetical protein
MGLKHGGKYTRWIRVLEGGITLDHKADLNDNHQVPKK